MVLSKIKETLFLLCKIQPQHSFPRPSYMKMAEMTMTPHEEDPP